MDGATWIPILISGASLSISILSLTLSAIIERRRRHAKLEVWKIEDRYELADESYTEIRLLFRNSSHRPTAVHSVGVMADGGSIGSVSIHKQINKQLPMKIDSWGMNQLKFRIELEDTKRMTSIYIDDLDGRRIVIHKGEWKGRRATT